MALPPILTCKNISLTFGGKPLFEDLEFSLSKGEKICLVGRNGSGKSTLLKIISGQIQADNADIYQEPGIKISYLTQDLTLSKNCTLLEFILSDTSCESYEALSFLDRLDLDPNKMTLNLSGGERRKLALCIALVGSPDVLLLDEPTNHLDINTIEWLEDYLKAYRGALMVISHDRAFLNAISNQILWLDLGKLYRHAKGFSDFEVWSDQILADREKTKDRLDTKLRLEEHWMMRGVTARRKRNQGRLRLLLDMRSQKKEILSNQTKNIAYQNLGSSSQSKMIVELHKVSKGYSDKKLFSNFSLRLLKGDRIGIIGPNGVGKTTFLKVLMGEIPPDSGEVRHGTNMACVYFDQQRQQLNDKESLIHTLCPKGGDQVNVQGVSRHVMSYLKDFLFTDAQIQGRVSILSGGEKNRLALAKAMAQNGNLLVLDEPTNDLDMDTLDLLQDILSDYPGTLLIVSHDRDFLDRLVTSTIVFEGNGKVCEYVGGYSDYLAAKNEKEIAPKTKAVVTKSSPPPQETKKRIGYKEKREFELLEEKIKSLTHDIQQLQNRLDAPGFYENHPVEFMKTSEKLSLFLTELEHAEESWLHLATLFEEV